MLAYAERLGEEAVLAEALAAATMVEFLLGGGVDEGKLARALALEDQEHRVLVQFRPTLIAGFLAFYVGDFERARSFLYPLRDRFCERGQEADLPFLLTTMSWLECCAGDLRSARSLAVQAHESAVLTESETMAAPSLSVGALVEAHAGQVEECRERMHAALRATGDVGYGLAATWAAAARGHLELSLGDAAAAHRALEPLTELVEAQGLVERVRGFFLPDEIEALVALGQLERAERLVDMLEERGSELDRAWALATGARGRGLLLAARGELALDEAALERALPEHGRVEMPLDEARTLLCLGRMQRRASRRKAARETLRRALALFETLGSPLWAEQARRDLGRLGARRAADGLTVGELRVAELAAAGLTNREIASRLFMSRRTVEANLARAYRKLGVGSRAELGARMVERARD